MFIRISAYNKQNRVFRFDLPRQGIKQKYHKKPFADTALLDQFFDFEAYGERLAERVPFAATENGWVAKL